MTIRKVLISPGFGAGWSTWNRGSREIREFMLFHPGLIAAIEAQKDLGCPPSFSHDSPRPGSPLEQFVVEFREKFPGEEPYLGGADQLKVKLVDGQFIVEEYDGSESLRLRDAEEDWI